MMRIILMFLVTLVLNACAQPKKTTVKNVKNIKGWTIYVGDYHGDHGKCFFGIKRVSKHKWEVRLADHLKEIIDDRAKHKGWVELERGSFYEVDLEGTESYAALELKSDQFKAFHWAIDSNADAKAGRSKHCRIP